jgi:SNF2 family DNA or RNA helicase
MVDKLFVPKLNEQAVDRAHRIGADETLPVTILEFIARGTVEARIETILKWKSSLFGAVVDQEDFKKKLLRLLLEDDDDL